MFKKLLISLFTLSSALLSSCVGATHHEIEEYKRELNYHKDFKIMQLTDIHFGIEMDNETEINHLKKIIEDGKDETDLIIITGDSFLDANKHLVNLLFDTIDSYNIPWAFTYGNHDLQGEYDSFYINDVIKSKTNSIFVDFDDDDLTGLTNYYINLKDGEKTKYRLYIIDSNSYAMKGIKYQYDIIHDEQLRHVEEIYRKDPCAGFAFFHIPLNEYQVAWDQYKAGEISPEDVKGENNEACCPGYTDQNHAFSRFKNSGILGTFVGHDHVNYSDIKYNGMILSYGVKATDLVYHNNEIIGYKMITLPIDVKDFGLSSIESRFVTYDK